MDAARYRLDPAATSGPVLSILAALLLAAPASAGTIAVTTTFDELDGAAPCSLREAIKTANDDADSGGCTDTSPVAADKVVLGSGDYSLSRLDVDEDLNVAGDLDVREDLTIAGAGAALTGIDGNGGTTGERTLQVISSTLTLSKVTVLGGKTDSNGGGIDSYFGTLKLYDTVVSGNVGGGGGGIFATGATLVRSTVSGNIATYGGGGISADGGLTLTDSTVSGNRAESGGGGIYAYGGGMLTRSTVSGNTAGGPGGGVFAYHLKLVASTVSDNAAIGTNGGGGLAGDDLRLDDSTVRRNRSATTGGGITTVSSTEGITVSRSTVADNDAIGHGGGIYFNSPGTLYVINSTLRATTPQAYGGGRRDDEGTTISAARRSTGTSPTGVGSATVRHGDREPAEHDHVRQPRPDGRPRVPRLVLRGRRAACVSHGYNVAAATPGCFGRAGDRRPDASPTRGWRMLADNGGRDAHPACCSAAARR